MLIFGVIILGLLGGASGHAQDYDCLLSTNATQTRPKRSPTLVGHSHLLSKVEHPTFDYTVPTNITTQLGQTVYLHCKVHNLGDKVLVKLLPAANVLDTALPSILL
ncbi:uncharacterized protein CDAR_197781 [Caerostris darwini]|uniref:Uncharacterized protein n=1 Tax=Caerostris darwini TaxID=1538125 RepID=A0AAV4S9Y1_9ARAC|nr:uncharacterized protein CDAR_197781 [Caerostris darwini]